ncbi:hypothetical protein F1559_004333 [Cyanidiococcus yangmingshanensis]|uniref:Uncharacterized protein n=1 Tax=Cyanidiococcus yangmingshanensis TaxID=2690220 RepID=A0A7J7IQC3_9RHOD|nr:hypothetical protein F1559_004333 [Cyanidiococcus yangmingshanensis]
MLCFMSLPVLFIGAGPVAWRRKAHFCGQFARCNSAWPQGSSLVPGDRPVKYASDPTRAVRLVALAKKRSNRAKRKSDGGGGFEPTSQRQPVSRPTEQEQLGSRVTHETGPKSPDDVGDDVTLTAVNQEQSLGESKDMSGNGHAHRDDRDRAVAAEVSAASDATDADERHTLHVQQPRTEKAVQELLSGVSLRSNQELSQVMQALQLADADVIKQRAPMTYRFRQLFAFAEEALLRDEDLEQLEGVRKSQPQTQAYAPLQQVALQGLTKAGVAAIAANRHYFDNRFFYGLSALRLAAEHRGQTTERDRLTLLAFRAQQSVRIIDAPLMRALNEAERTVQELLEEMLKVPAEQLESLVESTLKDASSANLVAIWLVVYAASAAWEMRRLQDPRNVNQKVVHALLQIRSFLRTRETYRARLPAELHWLGQIALERDRTGEERLLREPPDPVETTARVGGLAASLAQASSNAYIALSRMFRYLYDALRRIHFEAGDLLEDAEDILCSPDIQSPEPQVESRFQRITLQSIESA